jgi:hypothetical protein
MDMIVIFAANPLSKVGLVGVYLGAGYAAEEACSV